MKPTASFPKRRARARLALAAALGWLGICAAQAQTSNQAAAAANDAYRKVGKFEVTYSDTELGAVRGAAWCRWSAPDARCLVRVRNPKTGDLAELKAEFSDIRPPYGASRNLAIVLHGASPSSGTIARSAPLAATGQAGNRGTGTITLKNGDTTQKTTAPIWSQAAVDDRTVTLDLEPDELGRLTGEWRYRADPVTERDAKGAGRVGWFHTLPDNDNKNAPAGGGLKGLQEGREIWLPLAPRFYSIYTIEDQAAFDGVAALYPRLDANGNGTPAQKTRTLVLIGKDMPVVDRQVFSDIEGSDGLTYKVIADSSAGDLSDAEKIAFERARKAMEQDAPADIAAEYRKLQAVLVKVTITGNVDAGGKSFRWSGTQSSWSLQYGNNTADIRFERLLNDKQSELVQQMAVPEKLVIEVETGAHIGDDSIPLQLGGPGVAGDRQMFTATRVSANIYRTQPIVFSPQGATPPGGGAVVTVIPGKRVQATVDWTQTNFLRANLAAAVAGPPQTVWLDALHKAAACDKLTFDNANWPAFAAKASDTLSRFGAGKDSVPVKYGDHAAMIILRETFANAMQANLTALQKTAVTPVSDNETDELIDGWYRSVHRAVWTVPDYPLAMEMVPSPAGEVPFIKAFDTPFKEQTFQTLTSADGYRRWIKWRREASLAVLTRTLDNMKKALADAQATDPCDRTALLKLTGSGFRNIGARISPLLMKFATPGQQDYGTRLLAEPDYLARGYVNNIDQLGAANEALSAFAQARNAVVVSVASLFVPAASWTFGWVSTTAETMGTLTNTLGGLAIFTLQTKHDLEQLYQDREDIAFALGSYQVIGLDRYFDAESKQSDWWTTGLNIFGNALLTGTSLTTVDEGLATIRGGRVFARVLASGPAPALTAAEEADMALFVMKEFERADRFAAVSRVADAADRYFSKRATGAKGAPAAADPPAVIQELDRAAVADAVGLESPAKVADPTEAETKRVQAGEARAGEDNQVQQAGRAMAEDPAKAAPEVPGQLKPVERPYPLDLSKLPPENKPGTIETTIKGEAVTFETERALSGGQTSHVYVLKKVPDSIRELVNPVIGAPGKKAVIKLLRDPANPGPGVNPGKGLPDYLVNATMRRLKMVEELLADSQSIPHARFQVFEKEGIILQEFVEFKKGQVELMPETENSFKDLPDDQRAAVMELFKKFWDQKLVCLDCHHGNLYFEKEGGKWVAKVLDTDFICTFDEVQKANSPFRDYFEYFVKGGNARSDWNLMGEGEDLTQVRPTYFSSPQAFMLKFLEQKFWIRYGHVSQVYGPGYLRVEDIKPYLPADWPLRTEAPPGKQAPQQPAPQKGGWMMEPFDGLPLHGFANHNRAPSLLALAKAA